MSVTKWKGLVYAMSAGLCASLASVFGKMAVNSTHIQGLMEYFPLVISPEVITNFLRLVSFALIFACNALMWNFFAKSLDCTNSIQAVVVNTATNFFVTVCTLQ
jgi:hypothetical protein